MHNKPAPSTEPETLGPADVAGMSESAHDTRKPDRYLDGVFAYLTAEGAPLTARWLVRKVFENPSPDREAIYALERQMANDPRFQVLDASIENPEWDLAGAPVRMTEEESDAIGDVTGASDDAPPADDEPPAPITDTPSAQEHGKSLGEMLAASIANGQPPIESTLAQPISSTIASATPEAAAPLTDQEQHDLLHKAMAAHQTKGQALSAGYFAMRQTEASQQADLQETREKIKEHVKVMAAHMAAVPTLATLAQRTIAFDTQCETGPGDQPQAEGGEAPAWPYVVPPEHTISAKDLILASDPTMDEMIARILLEIPPSEKPMQIKEHVVTVKGSDYLPRQASPDCTRVFLQPVVSRDTWQQIHEEKYGRALKDFDQTDEAQERRQAGGDDCGRTVKVGRAVCVMGPECEGLVIVAAAPADAPTDIPPMASVAAEDAGE